MVKTLRQLLIKYQTEGKAIPAFNIDSLEKYQIIEELVKETSLPCIIQLSSIENKTIPAEHLLVLVKKARADGLPIYINMDHSTDQVYLEKLINLGFDMVHFDGSKMDYFTNLETSSKFIHTLKKYYPNILFEVGLNHYYSDNSPISKNIFSYPSLVNEFIIKTSADLLAISTEDITSNTNSEIFNLNLLTKIKHKLPEDRFLSLHCESNIDDRQICQAIQFGVVKINLHNKFSSINDFKNAVKSKLIIFSTPKYA